jgi:hypothetical protein
LLRNEKLAEKNSYSVGALPYSGTIKKEVATLSQKQFGKYLSLEIFPASMGIVLVLF